MAERVKRWRHLCGTIMNEPPRAKKRQRKRQTQDQAIQSRSGPPTRPIPDITELMFVKVTIEAPYVDAPCHAKS